PSLPPSFPPSLPPSLRLASSLNSSLVGVEWGDERSFRLEGAMGATRESLLRISSSSGSGGGGGGSGGREGEGEGGGVETDAWRSLVVINGVLAECVRANDTKGATQMLRMMVKAQQAADLSTFNALLAVYSERGDGFGSGVRVGDKEGGKEGGPVVDVSAALGVWQELRVLYPGQQTCRQAWETVLEACVRDPMGIEPALEILEEMARSGWNLERQYYLPLMDQLGYDAVNLERTLEPFRLSVGYLEAGDDALAALLFTHQRLGFSLIKASEQLCAFGLGISAVQMTYLRLDQPKKQYRDERKALLASFEMRSTIADLGWLQLDSEYDNPQVAARQYAIFVDKLLTHFNGLKNELHQARLEQEKREKETARNALRNAPTLLLKKGGREGGGAAAAATVPTEVERMVLSNKAGRREAKGERTRRQLTKLKEKRVLEAAEAGAAPFRPKQQHQQHQHQQQQKGGGGGGGGGGDGGGSGRAALASAPRKRVQRETVAVIPPSRREGEKEEGEREGGRGGGM
ncbi:Hypothetical protein NocV09_01402090, partial [Nannochloropsis oceanica]